MVKNVCAFHCAQEPGDVLKVVNMRKHSGELVFEINAGSSGLPIVTLRRDDAIALAKAILAEVGA